MLTNSQRESLLLRLRKSRTTDIDSTDIEQIPRRGAGLSELPLSYGQEQLWFADRFAPGLPTYNIALAIQLSGSLDRLALDRALGALIARHEALRTRLVTSDSGRPVQVIDPLPIALEVEDLTGFELRTLINAEAMRPFDLAAGPLLRICLVRLAAGEHLLVVVVHHTVFDGWSAGVFVRDLAALYRSEVTGSPSGLAELPVQFADYALWERDRFHSDALAVLEDYWRALLAGFETVQFPTDRPRPVIDDFAGGLAEHTTDAALLADLREVSRREGTTLFVTLLAALFALLHRYTGQSDLVVGTASANRGRAELTQLIGHLVNTLPIRCDLSGDPAFTDVVALVKEATVGAFAHQDLPFGKLVEVVGVERDASRSPVFQIALTFAERDDTPVPAAGVEFLRTDLIVGIEAAKFDLAFAAEARRDGLWVECCYKTVLFDPGTIERLLGHLEMLLRSVVASPAARLSELPLLTEAELRAELHDWNDTAGPVRSGCVHEGFEKRVAVAPDAVAAVFEGEWLTYAGLNEQANRIARRLRDLGVGPEVLAGVCMRTGLRRLAALLGVWKAGGGYVPLDPELPAERLSFMIADTGMTVVLTDDRSRASVPDTSATVLSLDADWGRVGDLPGDDLRDTGVTPGCVAYVIYTSGSTGQPKGVIVEHRQAVNALYSMIGHWQIGPSDAVLEFATFTFDVSVMDMFMPLLGGAQVVLAAPETLHSPPRLAALIRDARITFACLPPAVLDLLPTGEYPGLRILMAGGEVLTADLARRWIRAGLRLVNAYGPTETTVSATYAELDAATPMPPPIGRPARPNYRAYVLDDHLNPVPAGVTGELYIGGAGVTRGYLNRPGLTGQRFIPDPFTPGQRLYKTGDLVRRRPDGSIMFLGRIDNQVKIRGLRIELGEIEATLARHPGIAQAIVMVTGQPAGQRLTAYLRPVTSGDAISWAEVRACLARTLPAWMIPEHMIAVEEFPLSASGKLDRVALPEPTSAETAADHVEPATLIEIMLAGTYATLLDTAHVGATDSFFDLGGNSLQAMRLVSVLDNELDADIGVSAVFLAPTPRQLAALLCAEHGFSDEEPGNLGFPDQAGPGSPDMLSEHQRSALAARLRRGRNTGAAGRIARRDTGAATASASFGQEQLYFLDKFAPGQAVYNVPAIIGIRGSLDPDALSRALRRMVERHESLRTRLVADSHSRPVQVIDPPGEVTVGVEDLTGLGGSVRPDEARRARLRDFINAEAMRPFDLAKGPLLRASLARLDTDRHVLVSVIHHAVFDGWSAGVFLRDLAALYRSEVTGEPSGLAGLPVQFADYAAWERQHLQGPVLAQLESYWRRTMDGFETVQFPADRPRPAVDSFDGALAGRMTGADLLDGLRELSCREGTTLFVTLLAGLLALLSRYTGQTDLVVGTVSANRGRAQLAPLIGFLVNTLPIRCDLSGDPSFTGLLARVRDAVIGAFAHQDLPFAKLVDILKVERDASRAPVFQIAMTYAERDETPVRAASVDFAASNAVVGIGAAKFDMTFAIEACRTGLRVECCYKTALFDRGTIDRLLGHLEMLLRGVMAGPSARLSELPLLTEAELRAELGDWNDTVGPVPSGCVHDGFEAQAAHTPDAVAATYVDQRITYAELNRQANQIARRLRELGVGPEALVGVCMHTSLRRLAVLLGIWKAGGGYVPLDPALPAGRLAFMIADTGMTVIVTDATSAGRLPDAGAPVLPLDEDWERITGLDAGNLAGTDVTPGNVAYVIYTSGSTGQPKGVVVEHRNVVNFLHSMIGQWGVGPADAVLQFASLAFDASVRDMFMPLLAGARVVLAPAETLHSPPRLAALIRDAHITFACLTPAVLDVLPAGEYPDLRIVTVGGEELPTELARRWIRPGLRLINLYGPTETTVNATHAELDATTPMPPAIGFPNRPNYRAYVLDHQLRPVPPGVTGELHIGGASVARGYLNRPELTRERFIPDPFRPAPGARLYKTGDLVRRRPDGSIVFTGRADHQVKIRGLRIELGEIEATLGEHPGIAQAIVTVVAGPAGASELAAYLRTVPGSTVNGDEVRAWLARTLPSWMIPAHLISVADFPLTTSGKIDKNALPPPRRPAAAAAGGPGQFSAAGAAPETPTEAVLVGIYAALLGTDRVGVTDSFFNLGGNSLTAMRLVDMISGETGVDLGVAEIFLHPSPRRLAASIDAVKSGAAAGGPGRFDTAAGGPGRFDTAAGGPGKFDTAAGGPGKFGVARQAANGLLVELSTGTSRPPMFLIHPVGGTVSAYTHLGQELAGSLTVYGVQSPGLGDAGALASSLTDLVTDYTQRIRDAQPAGPYALAGWSMGGVIAFEIARRLEQDGAAVSLLVLLDAPFAVPAGRASGPGELAGRFVADVAHGLGWDTAGPPGTATTAGQLAWLAARLSGGGDPAERDAVQARLERRFELFAAHSRMLAGYRPAAAAAGGPGQFSAAAGGPGQFSAAAGGPGQFSAAVRASTLIVSADGSLNASARACWPDLLSGPVTTVCVDSDHYAFLRPPLVADVGAVIRKQWEGQADGR